MFLHFNYSTAQSTSISELTPFHKRFQRIKYSSPLRDILSVKLLDDEESEEKPFWKFGNSNLLPRIHLYFIYQKKIYDATHPVV